MAGAEFSCYAAIDLTPRTLVAHWTNYFLWSIMADHSRQWHDLSKISRIYFCLLKMCLCLWEWGIKRVGTESCDCIINVCVHACLCVWKWACMGESFCVWKTTPATLNIRQSDWWQNRWVHQSPKHRCILYWQSRLLEFRKCLNH